MAGIQRAMPLQDAMDEYEEALNFNEQVMGLPADRREELMRYYRNDLVDPQTAPEAEVALPPLVLARYALDAQGNPTAEYRNNMLQMRADQAFRNVTPARQQGIFSGLFNTTPTSITPEPPLRQFLAQQRIPFAYPIDDRGIAINRARPVMQERPRETRNAFYGYY